VYSGESHTAGRTVKGPGRDRGIVYQHYSLFPFLTAQQNVAFGLMLDQTSIPSRLFKFPQWMRRRKAHMEESAAFLERVGLGEAIKLYPSEMSGGMRQRVAIAQALIMKPEIILLDEPFGALDEATREDLQRMLLALYDENRQALKKQEEPPYTIFIVTHELNEAIYVGDRVIGLSQYWGWEEAGHKAPPGATITYDRKAPVYHPGEERDVEEFAHQRSEIRRIVFDPEAKHAPMDHRSFWEDDHIRQPSGGPA
jgi:NitT/TauT family transport system ATP-binding protein